MRVLFFCDPVNPRALHEAYEHEASAAAELGIGHELLDDEALGNEGDAARAVRRVPAQPDSTIFVYRGWMLKPSQYQPLYDALAAKRFQLINDPVAYQHCHSLSESYSAIESMTPQSVWMKTVGEVSMAAVMELLRPFGSNPVKDEAETL